MHFSIMHILCVTFAISAAGVLTQVSSSELRLPGILSSDINEADSSITALAVYRILTCFPLNPSGYCGEYM